MRRGAGSSRDDQALPIVIDAQHLQGGPEAHKDAQPPTAELMAVDAASPVRHPSPSPPVGTDMSESELGSASVDLPGGGSSQPQPQHTFRSTSGSNPRRKKSKSSDGDQGRLPPLTRPRFWLALSLSE